MYTVPDVNRYNSSGWIKSLSPLNIGRGVTAFCDQFTLNNGTKINIICGVDWGPGSEGAGDSCETNTVGTDGWTLLKNSIKRFGQKFRYNGKSYFVEDKIYEFNPENLTWKNVSSSIIENDSFRKMAFAKIETDQLWQFCRT